MTKRKKILIFTTALFLPVLLVVLSVPGSFRVITFKFRYNNLIYKTDHHALLAACRKLMDEGYSGKYNFKWPDRDPNADNFPEILLQLKPTYIKVEDKGFMYIEFLGGMSHAGVIAYAEDFNEPHEYFKYGNKKLIDGLWYQSDFVDRSDVDIDKKRKK